MPQTANMTPDIIMINKYGDTPSGKVIIIDTSTQLLQLYQSGQCLQSWDISSASRGVGNTMNSLQTPLGAHRIAKKIGAQCPPQTIFKGRQDTGQQARIITEACSSDEDLVTSRILWLKGIEAGLNLHGEVDTYNRYIYIHGTPEEGLIGQVASHGCIRMRNNDIITLFDLVENETLVYITDHTI